MPDEGLPQGLGRSFADGGAGRVLEVDLPPGGLVVPEEYAAEWVQGKPGWSFWWD